MTYEVLFKDSHGSSHHLTMIRQLRITDLPKDTLACNSSSPSVDSKTH